MGIREGDKCHEAQSDYQEMQRIFNNGIGIVAIVPPDATADVLQRLKAMNEKAFLIGEILECKNSNQRVIWE